MDTLLNSTVSVRSLAVLILALVAFWYVSIVGCVSEIGSREWFWAAVLILLPFVIAVFAAILFKIYKQSGRQYRRWFCAAIIAAGTCGALVGCYLLLIGFA